MKRRRVQQIVVHYLLNPISSRREFTHGLHGKESLASRLALPLYCSPFFSSGCLSTKVCSMDDTIVFELIESFHHLPLMTVIAEVEANNAIHLSRRRINAA
jgi:hypothetical protein